MFAQELVGNVCVLKLDQEQLAHGLQFKSNA
jgi:hypothetical protein